jgi:hypothetical protein
MPPPEDELGELEPDAVDGKFRTPGDENEVEEDEITVAIAAVAAPLPQPGYCLWPLDDTAGRPGRWCGARTAGPGRPYCGTHQALARLRR